MNKFEFMLSKLQRVFISTLLMIIATVCFLFSMFLISEHIKKDEINLPNEISKPQIQQELIEIKKVGE